MPWKSRSRKRSILQRNYTSCQERRKLYSVPREWYLLFTLPVILPTIAYLLFDFEFISLDRQAEGSVLENIVIINIFSIEMPFSFPSSYTQGLTTFINYGECLFFPTSCSSASCRSWMSLSLLHHVCYFQYQDEISFPGRPFYGNCCHSRCKRLFSLPHLLLPHAKTKWSTSY